MKLFKTGSIDIVKNCQSYFAIDLPLCDLKRRQDKFIVLNKLLSVKVHKQPNKK